MFSTTDKRDEYSKALPQFSTEEKAMKLPRQAEERRQNVWMSLSLDTGTPTASRHEIKKTKADVSIMTRTGVRRFS
jgi:hypothetical protein